MFIRIYIPLKKELIVYRLKLLIKFFVEFLIKICSFSNILFFKCIRINSNHNFSEKYRKYNKKENLNLFIFKSGTMGDHLIIISVIQYLRSIGFSIDAFIVCRRKSIFPGIKTFGEKNNIKFIDYVNFLKNFPTTKKNRIVNNIFIDSEPNFRIGYLFGLIKKSDFISTNYENNFDFLIEKSFKNISFSTFNENMSEGQYILNLINKYLYQSGRFNFKNKKNYEEFLISPKITKEKLFEPKFLYFKKFLSSLDSNKENLYLYYGCSGKALHRLPSTEWLMSFIKLLKNEFNIVLVGGEKEKEFFRKFDASFNTDLLGKFSLCDWEVILSHSKFKMPLLSFDGGFTHLFGLYSNKIFQVFASSNGKKWGHRSSKSRTYNCLKGGSPNYKPFKFKVPENCMITNKAWEKTNPELIVSLFKDWFFEIKNN